MKGKIHYRIKDRQPGGTEQNYVKDFANAWQLAKVLIVAIRTRAKTIHLYYSQNKNIK